ncbi:hypothetical protein AVEN_178912-1 [Araneus ventricosus]|uniref:Uncharacterized protein n=2 Tax=Araneus ventricosus TaxID=182803 RepID=A0A4Y2IEK3_ARAVE|nr:hypothetical protein AVEN_178912-1 [Araneus ventricosus]
MTRYVHSPSLKAHLVAQVYEIDNKHSFRVQHEEEQLDIRAAVQQYESRKTVEDNTNFESEILRIRNEMNERRNKFLDKLDKDRYEKLLQIKEGYTTQLEPPFA